VTSDEARVWLLLGGRTGDNNQLLRLADELGKPYQAIELRYNKLALLPPRAIGASFASVEADSRRQLQPPWPDLVLGIGNRSVPVALAIRKLSGGKARLVRLGNPRLHPRHFDLVITTNQYAVPDSPNVLRLPVGISTAAPLEPTSEERDWLDKLPRPHRLLLIGGATFMWRLTPDRVAAAVATLRGKGGGSIIAVSSGRSSKAVLDRTASALSGGDHGLVFGRFPRYPVLLQDADEIYVTADSVAMISDAVTTGKPVGLVTPEQTVTGRLFYGLGIRVPVRDIRCFWTHVEAQGLAGSVEKPVAGKLSSNPLGEAVAAVRGLLDD